jgi:hypothetical protein
MTDRKRRRKNLPPVHFNEPVQQASGLDCWQDDSPERTQIPRSPMVEFHDRSLGVFYEARNKWEA